ncbi:MAG: ATP-binding cassette domain-containing protein [Treponema sp.]|jgi:zinc transport system ATP-binding protein|nr:ATP-binding cassette domain-containing protein [Treponema sp.]
MNKMNDDILTCQNAAFGYDGRIVVNNISFAVQSGGYLYIIGENGSGKSTLVKGILRLISPLQGRVYFSPHIKTREIGYLSQASAVKKDFPANVSEIVLSGLVGAMGLRPFYSRADKAIAEDNMKRLDIYDLKDCCFRELSGGQQRRVLIARALCASHKLLVLDEPTDSLDPLATQELYNLLAKLNRETGITIITVTHDVHAAVKYASHILHIKYNQYFFGTLSEYTRSDYAKSFFIDNRGVEND